MWQGLMDSVLHSDIHILHVHKHMNTFKTSEELHVEHLMSR